MSEHDERLLISVETAAKRLTWSRAALYPHVTGSKQPVLRSVRLGRSRRIAVRDLEAFIDSLRAEAAAAS